MSSAALMVGNFLSESLPGRRSVCEDLADRLRARGHALICTSAYARPARKLADMMWTAWTKRSEYSVAHVEVYSGRAFAWAEATCAVLRRAGKPYVLALHGGNLPVFARRRPRRVSRLLASAAAVTAPSEYLARAMHPYRLGVLVVPNAIDVASYPYRTRTAARPALVWLRGFHRIYNPAMAVEVFRLLAPEYPDIRLTMIGPDRGDGSLERTRRLALKTGAGGRIVFAGPAGKDALLQRLNEADIFLNTADVDNTPVSVVEAMACGLCVASTNAGGIPDLLRHGEDALLSPCGDAAAMAEHVMQILREPALARRLSETGRKRAGELDWSAVLPQWERVLAGAAAFRDS